MTTHVIATREKWLEARLDLLAAEKDLMRRSDDVDGHPGQSLTQPRDAYVFDGPDGRQTLADWFDGRHQLLVQHFMLKPGAEVGCKGCSYMADHVDGMTVHLAHRDVTFVAISRAPLTEIERFRRRMGWQFKWVSSYGTTSTMTSASVSRRKKWPKVESITITNVAAHGRGVAWCQRLLQG